MIKEKKMWRRVESWEIASSSWHYIPIYSLPLSDIYTHLILRTRPWVSIITSVYRGGDYISRKSNNLPHSQKKGRDCTQTWSSWCQLPYILYGESRNNIKTLHCLHYIPITLGLNFRNIHVYAKWSVPLETWIRWTREGDQVCSNFQKEMKPFLPRMLSPSCSEAALSIPFQKLSAFSPRPYL